MAIPSDNPKITYSSYVLWIPRKFTKWDCSRTVNPVFTEGHTYVQTLAHPVTYTVKAVTAPWHPTTENWFTSGGSPIYTDWISGWRYFWESYASQGGPFTFYRTASYSGAADGIHRFDRCVWRAKDDGLNQLTGWERYTWDLEFTCELAGR